MDFSKLQDYINGLHTEKGVPGCDVMVYHEGKPVYRYCTGYADYERQKPLSEDALYFLYSCSKPITATAAMQLVERGVIGLDDPVMTYLPAFADAYVVEDGRRVTVGPSMTVRHLFTMSAGLDYNLNRPAVAALREKAPEAGTVEVVSAFAADPLSFRPGERFQYSLCHDALAAVVEVASGERFGDYLQQHIFAPLGMTDVGFDLSPEQTKRVVAQYAISGADNAVTPVDKSIGGFRITKNYQSGGAGLFASTEAYGRFAAAMSLGGVSAEGVRILRPETVALMQQPQLGTYTRNDAFGCAAGPGYGYGLGVRTLVSKAEGQRSHLGEIGWDGAAGSYILMDPDAKVAIVYTQHVRNWPARFGSMHEPIRDLTYEIVGL